MKAYAIVDLGFGDAGKGTTVDFLSRLTPNTLIVRYNGGPQAAHNVVTAQGVHHTFAQFGSGTLVPSVKTYLSKYMWIEPLSLLNENEGLKEIGVTDALPRLSIDLRAPIITPFHRSANRIKERVNRHGSCGRGMGEAVADSLDGLVLKVETICFRKEALKILRNIREKKRNECTHMDGSEDDWKTLNDPQAPEKAYDIYKYLINRVNVVPGVLLTSDQIIFEGAGGVLLDENYGFHPHTMWTTTTTENVKKLWKDEVTTLGVIRTYSTRHGNGPFVSECSLPFVDKYNITNEWQGNFRTGIFDLSATKYALKVNGGVDALVVTHTDEVCPVICDAYEELDSFEPIKGDLDRQQELTNKLFKCSESFTSPHTAELEKPFIKEISDRLNLPVTIESFGAKANEKRIITKI